jgi:uncharacterized protein YbjT (DUF2867 family)
MNLRQSASFPPSSAVPSVFAMDKVVVAGATGNVGKEVVRLLGGDAVGVSRATGVDLGEPESLREVVDGADAVFLLVAGERPGDLLDVVKAGGVRRVVLLSSQGAGTRPEAYRHPVAFEDAVRESGLEWTVLRPGGFHSNAFAWAQGVREHRLVTAPFGDVALPGVDPADIAAVAAAALREEGHAERTYELTGPEAVSPRDRARLIGEAVGEPVRFAEQTRDEARAWMLGFMPEPVVEGTLAILGEPTARERATSPDVERVLGRPATGFADWAHRNAAAFR